MQLISLIWGKHFHIFKPPPDAETSPDDEEFWMHVLVQQVRYFGPWPPSYTDFISEEEEQFLSGTMQYVHEKGWRKPFELLQDKEVTLADKMFISKMMQMDPRDRPTAKVLLEDEWFDHP
jgi:casein kinase II subunit alpha